jgi:hypothetical protein
MEGGTATSILSQVVTDVIGVGGQCISFMNANPIMWVGVGFGFVGAGINLVKKASKVGGRKRG